MVRMGMILDHRYELMEEIGSGGMSNVYKARNIDNGHYVAIKILRREYNEDAAFVRKFIAEARSTEGLTHPNIVKIYDAGKDQGLYYIVMELAEGMTLKHYIRRYGRLSARETVDFALQIAEAIKAAHDHGIIHRDIKPQNILVSDGGNIKVTDFGIAKAATGDTISSNAMGSVRYLSPEQARGGYSDYRSDIYSLGITIYEMATGRVPFDGDNSVAIALMHLQNEITPPRDYFPDIPVSLENIILKCTRKRPEERYSTAGELIDDLLRVFESPDGNYVYLDSLVDDSPTRARTRDEIDAIKKSLGGGYGPDGSNNQDRREGLADESGSGKRPARKKSGNVNWRAGAEDKDRETRILEEDYNDDEETRPRFEKMILIVSVIIGIGLGCFIIFVVGRSMHLFRLPFEKTTESTTEAPGSEASTQASTEAEKVSVPDFVRLSKQEALARAEKHSLNVTFSKTEDAYNYEDKDLIVIAQDHEKGDQVVVGTVISLTLDVNEAAKPQRVEVPALTGMEQSKAIEALEAVGLKASVIYAASDEVNEGYVIRQNPDQGTEVDLGFTITITVSKGVGEVRVPSLTGVSRDYAEKLLNDVGLRLGKVSSDYSGSVGVGDVIDQDIPSGSMVKKGTEVSITISLGEQETYHYEATISMEDSPFAEGESGSLSIEVEQDGETRQVYSNESATAESFPININYQSEIGEEAIATIYVNGEEYDSYSLSLSAVAD
ncbi:MAG: Stk1 family PASTA domain-containing Ser/Thr kinase [Eubacterium sp.]|nr:Stk1 family PASTA domain-containing Ser/Thr kinase [Eubacterium sp.]